MPDDLSRANAMTPPFEALMAACARSGTTAERRADIAAAIETIDTAIREHARATGEPIDRYWRDVLARLRHAVREPRAPEVMACLLQAQALILARAFPKIGLDNLSPGG